jgi:zinc protease
VAGLKLDPDGAAAADDAPLLAELPKPGRITGQRRFAEPDITEWTLSNGARVLFKPTANNPDEILIRAVSPGGAALLHDTLFFSPGRMVAEMMTQAAGLGNLDRDALGEQLATSVLREYAVELTPHREGMRLGGSPKDLETLFQLLHLQFTAPKLDTAALGLWQRRGSPQGSYTGDDALAQYLSGDNPRLAPPSLALMALADTGRALAVFRDRFGNAGDFTFIVVGAATAQQVKPLVERYLATLPSTGKRETPLELGVRPLQRRVANTSEIFDLPRAVAQVLYAGEFPSTPEEYLTEQRRLSALGLLLQMRFTDVLREQMGGTYGAGVSAWTTAVPQEHYRFAINFVAAPQRVHGMLDTTFAVIDSVRARGASADELRKVAAMQRRVWESDLHQNRFWLDRIELYDRLRIPFARIVEPPKPPTSEEIRGAAERYLPNAAYLNFVQVPRDSSVYLESERAQGGSESELRVGARRR